MVKVGSDNWKRRNGKGNILIKWRLQVKNWDSCGMLQYLSSISYNDLLNGEKMEARRFSFSHGCGMSLILLFCFLSGFCVHDGRERCWSQIPPDKKKETVRYILVDVDIQMGAGGNPLSCSGATEHHEYHSCLSKCLFCASRFNKRTRQFWKASIPISDLSWFTPIKWKGMKQRAAQLPIIQRPWKPWNFGNIPGGTVYKSLSRAKWQSSNKIVREFSSWRSIKGRKPLISCRLGVTSMNRHMNDLKPSLWNDPDSTDLGLVDQWMNDSINMNDLRRYLVSFSLWNGLKAKRERRSWSLAVLESNQTVTMSNWLVIYRIHQIYRVQCWLS